MGRFILLTYNLSALYAYSLSAKDARDDDDEVRNISRISMLANTYSIQGRYSSLDYGDSM